MDSLWKFSPALQNFCVDIQILLLCTLFLQESKLRLCEVLLKQLEGLCLLLSFHLRKYLLISQFLLCCNHLVKKRFCQNLVLFCYCKVACFLFLGAVLLLPHVLLTHVCKLAYHKPLPISEILLQMDSLDQCMFFQYLQNNLQDGSCSTVKSDHFQVPKMRIHAVLFLLPCQFFELIYLPEW